MKLTLLQAKQINKIGISEDSIQSQYENLISGPKPLDLKATCEVGKGIKALNNIQKSSLVTNYSGLVNDKKIVNFVPASGAATRMFKHLFNPADNKELVDEFLDNLNKFAFYTELSEFETGNSTNTIKSVLHIPGLNYGKLPKAMISFHKYDNEVRKSIDEQLIEGSKYITQDKNANFHFTISKEHEGMVKEYLNSVLPGLQKKSGINFNIEFSFQNPNTDTVAMSSSGRLVEQSNGDLLLRPGGHGALIHNLSQINADLVFIKNIDNIVRESYQEVVVEHKKALGSLLVNLQDTVFSILRELEESEVTELRIQEIIQFLHSELNLSGVKSVDEIIAALNKPIRVCGMVKNQGKAGGGPFWVGDSVQIVESAQIDVSNPEVAKMLTHASHFNPVDLVCGLKDYHGNLFDLNQFIDHDAFFVADKSIEGENIKVLELPGLWNGAMAHWITVFVEVPVETFHPVKTVNDLLQSAHSG